MFFEVPVLKPVVLWVSCLGKMCGGAQRKGLGTWWIMPLSVCWDSNLPFSFCFLYGKSWAAFFPSWYPALPQVQSDGAKWLWPEISETTRIPNKSFLFISCLSLCFSHRNEKRSYKTFLSRVYMVPKFKENKLLRVVSQSAFTHSVWVSGSAVILSHGDCRAPSLCAYGGPCVRSWSCLLPPNTGCPSSPLG